LLYKISENFDGMFGYIQDAKQMGTIFTNGIANTLCNASGHIELQMNNFNGVQIPISGLRYGQSSDILLDKVLVKPGQILDVNVTMMRKG